MLRNDFFRAESLAAAALSIGPVLGLQSPPRTPPLPPARLMCTGEPKSIARTAPSASSNQTRGKTMSAFSNQTRGKNMVRTAMSASSKTLDTWSSAMKVYYEYVIVFECHSSRIGGVESHA